MQPGNVILVLLDEVHKTPVESIENSNLTKHVSQFPEGWTVEVSGGGQSIEEMLILHEENNKSYEKYGHLRLGGPTISSVAESTNGVESTAAMFPTFAIDMNVDPLSQNIVYQSAFLSAPVVGNNQDAHSNFLSDVETNGLDEEGHGFIMQSGFLFTNGFGFIVWTDNDNYGFWPNFSEILYTPGHVYNIASYHPVGDPENYWWITAQDMTTGTYKTHLETNARGTRLRLSPDTSVFFENWNTGADWYKETQGGPGFTNPLSASYSRDSTNPYQGYKYWDYDGIIIYDAGWVQQPNNGVITGSLSHGGTAAWHLDKIFLAE